MIDKADAVSTPLTCGELRCGACFLVTGESSLICRLLVLFVEADGLHDGPASKPALDAAASAPMDVEEGINTFLFDGEGDERKASAAPWSAESLLIERAEVKLGRCIDHRSAAIAKIACLTR